jgi:chromosome segregation protein
MFRLERVEIAGFKSFYEKVDLAFPGRVTAVVGPNGCGKSNICDAVAWALGEQSARVLRGERMDDVIFNGSARRRPVGMAEVTLTLSRRGGNGGGNEEGDGPGNGNGHGEAAPESESLRIGRRVYREGHGEYFLNDKQVRLKDIQDQLSGTGLGVRAYSVIEQGRIDQVLSTKPQDRRRLIEEAAGITRYKLRKRLAETKLEETRGNLLRLSDIISEIERNVASLKRQASRAARYKEQSEALRGKRSSLLRARHDRLTAAVGDATRLRDERRDREAEAAAALGRSEAELAQARLDAAEATAARERARDVVSALETAIGRDEALIESNHRSAADLAARREALARETRDFGEEHARTLRELQEIEERVERAIAEARSRSLDREEADRKASAAAAALAGLETELEGARTETLTAAGEGVAARNARHEVDLSAERVVASLARLEGAAGKIAADLDGRERAFEAAAREERDLSAEAETAARALEAFEAELARLAAARDAAEEEHHAAREALGRIEHRAAALDEVARGREIRATDVRRALESAGIGARESLSTRLRPKRGWEEAVDLLLDRDAEALLVEVEGGGARALEAAGTVAALRLVDAGWAPEASAAPETGGWEAVLENWKDLSPAERAALPPAVFVESLADAAARSRRSPGTTFVTRRREIVRGSLYGAFRNDAAVAGSFALSRDRESLAAEAASSREKAREAEARAAELRREHERRSAEIPGRREAERRAAGALSAFAGRLEERREERDRLKKEEDTLTAEAAALRDEAAGLARRRAELLEEEARCAGREAKLRELADALSLQMPEARSFAMAATEELAHRRTEAEVAAERRRALEGAREKTIEARGTLDRRLAEAREEEDRIAQRAAELAREEEEARARQASNLGQRRGRAEDLSAATTAEEASAIHIRRTEEETKARRASLDAAREARFEAEVAETRLRSDLEHVEAEARTEFSTEAAELAPPADASEEALAALEQEAAELAASIERMGPVNVLALEEHKQETERLAFLTTQRDDLLRSVAELQESIRKINATSSERFRDAFTAINENFKGVFSRLFQGGTAEMRLLDENDLLESGIEIVAHPPGKRNQSILLLSGGEKALTAIALLIAIFRYKPSPFCILDEVDAPLDEANIDRFTRLLRDMTEETQFIAITHNKRTMETADAMYGVTMEEPGCSKIVSVRFD